MNISHLNIGILHSLIGKNDGVSIVIDQSVEAMVNHLEIPLGNIYFLSAHTSPRFNSFTDEVFWHKNDIHKEIVNNFSSEPPPFLDSMIHENAMYAKEVIEKFIEKNKIDFLIAHNTSHPYNFITAVGLGYYLEERRRKGYTWPKVISWWHDSYFERGKFSSPNKVVKKYLQYLPGLELDGIVFINKTQPDYAKIIMKKYGRNDYKEYLRKYSVIIPNTCDVSWNWKSRDWKSSKLQAPEPDSYNRSFYRDIGLLDKIKKRDLTINDAVILLQHTRVVPRKKIETAIDFGFKLEEKFRKNNNRKCIVLLVSGHSGDEEEEYKTFLKNYADEKGRRCPDAEFILIFGEKNIFSHRDIIVDKKYYKFSEIPLIVAASGGIGTYFSEIEGYGNNLLETVSSGLPTVINKYEIYENEIEPLGFKLPSIKNGKLTEKVVHEAYELLTDIPARNKLIAHNLKVLEKRLSHRIIAKKLAPFFERVAFMT